MPCTTTPTAMLISRWSIIAEAHIELGARAHGVEYHPWLDIRDHPLTPPLPDRPFRFHVSDTHQSPDGRPFYLKNASGFAAVPARDRPQYRDAVDDPRSS